MRTFGFKIVEQSRQAIEPVVARALADRRPIEVGLYYGDPEALDLLLERLPGSGLPVGVHLDHRRLSILDLELRESQLREQLELAARLGASQVVTHLSPCPMTRRPDLRKAMVDKVLAGLGCALDLCARYRLRLHLENTYHDLAFYRRLLEAVAARGCEGVHFCFDIGHAKVWSIEPLADWLGLLSDLADEGARLHLHLHANRGLNDDHLSFLAADRLGVLRADAFTGGVGYYQALAEIADRFPTASKVFEVPVLEAEDNLDHVLARIAALGSSRICA